MIDCLLCTSRVKAEKKIVFLNKRVPNESMELCDIHCSNILEYLEEYNELRVSDIK